MLMNRNEFRVALSKPTNRVLRRIERLEAKGKPLEAVLEYARLTLVLWYLSNTYLEAEKEEQ